MQQQKERFWDVMSFKVQRKTMQDKLGNAMTKA